MSIMEFLQTVTIGLAIGATIYNTRTIKKHTEMITDLYDRHSRRWEP